MKIQEDKVYEASQKVGSKGFMPHKRFASVANNREPDIVESAGSMKKMESPSKSNLMSQTMTNGVPDKLQSTLNSTALNMTMPALNSNNIMTTMYLQTGKGGLMQRMASPRAQSNVQQQTKGDKVSKSAVNSQASTLAATQTLRGGAMMRNTQSSPFRETIARGMVTGVGLLGN